MIRPSSTMNFYSGRIVHGLQFVRSGKRHEPTAYYGRRPASARRLPQLADRPHLRVGAVGLGVGTIATYARPGTRFPLLRTQSRRARRSAQKHFSFLADCQGRHEVVLGDARLSLEREESPQNFDLLVLDAFSGDAVPAHLLTAEAFEIYQRHLQPDGIMAVHISNRYLDLSPVLAGLAEQFGYRRARSRSRRATRAGPVSGPVAASARAARPRRATMPMRLGARSMDRRAQQPV